MLPYRKLHIREEVSKQTLRTIPCGSPGEVAVPVRRYNDQAQGRFARSLFAVGTPERTRLVAGTDRRRT